MTRPHDYLIVLMLIGVACSAPATSNDTAAALRMHQLTYNGDERAYYVLLPEPYDPDRIHWPLVVIHGGGGNARDNWKAHAIRREADKQRLDAIVIAPKLHVKDKQPSRFPSLGEGAFLKAVLDHARNEFKLRETILLNGYSMGGQFTHRFALQNPELVQACAPFAAGTWTTPQGTLLVQDYGEVRDPGTFLLDPANVHGIPERLHNLFDARTAVVAGKPAAEGASNVPFLVMCGILDPRLDIAQTFATRLAEAGFTVETGWPETPRGNPGGQYTEAFARYTGQTIDFFKRHAE